MAQASAPRSSCLATMALNSSHTGHSRSDEYILPEWTQEVYNAYSGPKELISEGLDHGTVYAYGQEKIEAAISKMS